ncbi:MAG: AraC family transcriptional regulator [Victivallales bacterium]|nr:AraC family transcriptional regulator [Victivallales bacterium]
MRDNYLESLQGFDIAFHYIAWHEKPGIESLPSGGNINYHSIPANGTTVHDHEFPEIILILRGRIVHRVNSETRELETGSLIFIRPSDTHSFKPYRNEPCEMLILSYQLELMLALSEFFENDSFMWRYTEPVLPPTFSLNPDEADSIANRLFNVNSTPFDSPVLMRTKVKVILADLFTRYFLENVAHLEQSDIPEWLTELCHKMGKEENLRQGLKRMHKLACCTPEHLCKTFRRYFKQTPTEFINRLRINYAARKLADSREEIMAIALDLNFQSLSRFYKLFKLYYGVTPAQYRKNAKIRRVL